MTVDKNFKRQFPGKIVTFKQKKAGTGYYDSLPLVLGIRIIGSKMFGIKALRKNLKSLFFEMST